ncbi:Nitrate/nitrite transporter [Candidatus Burkholderia humilis]|nr:Nitrate/nitrite transporter [Candidatus Burkholderia humilis]
MINCSLGAKSVDEKRLMRRIWWRIVPLVFAAYLAAYLDRVNVAFAALHMNKDLGLSSTQYGLGASVFFLAYFLFEVPSNLLLQRMGAKRWIARIMLTWGVISGLMALTTSASLFYVLRFLLGAAEAGFLPGVILYLGWWFPHRFECVPLAPFSLRCRSPLSSGGPVSGLILGMDGYLGIAGWQWLFILESLPALLLGCVVLKALPPTPNSATFISDAERQWLLHELNAESVAQAGHPGGIARAVSDPTVWILAAMSFGVNFSQYAFGM